MGKRRLLGAPLRGGGAFARNPSQKLSGEREECEHDAACVPPCLRRLLGLPWPQPRVRFFWGCLAPEPLKLGCMSPNRAPSTLHNESGRTLYHTTQNSKGKLKA